MFEPSSLLPHRLGGARIAFAAGLLSAGLLPLSAAAVPSLLEQVAPIAVTYDYGLGAGFDFYDMSLSTLGEVTAAVSGVDLMLGLGNFSTSGCEAADFAGFAAGHIALVQRGACTFRVKAENATAAGASGVLIFNQGNTLDRLDTFSGTLGAGYAGVPVLSLSYDLGAEFSSTPNLRVHMLVAAFEAVPEPASLALMAVRLLGLATVRGTRANASSA